MGQSKKRTAMRITVRGTVPGQAKWNVPKCVLTKGKTNVGVTSPPQPIRIASIASATPSPDVSRHQGMNIQDGYKFSENFMSTKEELLAEFLGASDRAMKEGGPSQFVGRRIARYFLVDKDLVLFFGTVDRYKVKTDLFGITYEDGDEEEVDANELGFLLAMNDLEIFHTIGHGFQTLEWVWEGGWWNKVGLGTSLSLENKREIVRSYDGNTTEEPDKNQTCDDSAKGTSEAVVPFLARVPRMAPAEGSTIHWLYSYCKRAIVSMKTTKSPLDLALVVIGVVKEMKSYKDEEDASARVSLLAYQLAFFDAMENFGEEMNLDFNFDMVDNVERMMNDNSLNEAALKAIVNWED
jgi:hypothetical protein